MHMWMVNPKLLCRKHLLGEHGEIHKHKHNFEKQHKISGRVKPIVLIEPESMYTRHNVLANEMIARGYNHKSDYVQPNLDYLSNEERYVKADIKYNLQDLSNRCEECAKNIMVNIL